MFININRRSNNKLLVMALLVLIFLLFITINLMSSKFFNLIRLDLTSNKVFSLSDGSKKIISNLNEPINLKLFFSKQLAKENPYFFSFALRVEEFLRQYQKYSQGKIKLQIIDPEPFTEYEDQAVHYGLQGAPVQEGIELYFGLVATNSTLGKEIIPFFQPNKESYLEYDITKLISKLNNQTANKIGLITSLAIQGEEGFQFMANKSKPWVVWQQIKQQFDPQILDEEQLINIPEDIKVLLFINTGEKVLLSTAKAIDDFVLRGGRVLLLADPLSEVKNNLSPESVAGKQDNNKTHKEKIALSTLLDAWGVIYDENNIVASRNHAKQVRYNHEGKETIGLYPLWIDVGNDSLAKDDIIVNNINKLTFATAGAIKPKENALTKFAPLVIINKDGMLINKENLVRYKHNPMSLLKEYQPQQDPIILAARLTGKIRSAFTDKVADQANIVIITNADFLHDHFWANTQNFLGNPIIIPVSGNSSLVLNTLDNLTGANELIGIRGKESYTKNFDKIHELELISQSKFQRAEESLLKELEATKKKLGAMEQNTLSVEHKKEEELFRKKLIDTRKQLREVRRSLREDIQLLENKIKFYTILFIPLLIVGSGIFYWLFGNKCIKLFRYSKL